MVNPKRTLDALLVVLALAGPTSLSFAQAPSAAPSSAPPATPSAPVPPMDFDEFVRRITQVLPPTWRIVEKDIASVPTGWTGQPVALYVMAEDTQTRFLHPNGFHYYSFYRIWLTPERWEGEMRSTRYVSDSVPAFLLGANDRYVVFYHTAGGNIWEDGPAALCGALDLGDICHTELSRRIVDLEIERRLVEAEEDDSALGFSIVPQRIIGLAGDGENLYLEYLFPDEQAPGDTLEAVTRAVAGTVFELIPEVETLYLRRCTGKSFTDTIVPRN